MGNLYLSKERVEFIAKTLNAISSDCSMFKGLTPAIAEDKPETADLIHRLAFIIQTRSVEIHNELVDATTEQTKMSNASEINESQEILEKALESQNV